MTEFRVNLDPSLSPQSAIFQGFKFVLNSVQANISMSRKLIKSYRFVLYTCNTTLIDVRTVHGDHKPARRIFSVTDSRYGRLVIALRYAHYVVTNGYIASEWRRSSACQAAIPGDRPFELCARARLRVCIQSTRKIYVCPACLLHTNVSMKVDVRSL